MSFFLWYQAKGSTAWSLARSEDRHKLPEAQDPEFVTVLDVSDIPEDDWKREQYLSLKYLGPFYMDWDGEDIEDTIQDFQDTLTLLIERGLNLECCRLYATGGRGFHLEVPMECFIEKPNRSGYAQLPAIYKVMAEKLQMDTTDMRVYSARRGRMWRTPNVQRPNGKYKVPISVEEAFSMTEEVYNFVCSEERSGPILADPQVCIDLATDFAAAKIKVDAFIAKSRKAKDETATLSQFPDKLPPAAKQAAACLNLNENVGFNQIAMQLAITFSAAGKSEEEFIEACAGLIQNHSGDGSRYNSPRKRREALAEMFYYVDSTDLYTYSVGGLRSIIDPDTDQADIDPSAEFASYDEALDTIDLANLVTPKAVARSQFKGLHMGRHGIVKTNTDGDQDYLSNMRFANVAQVVSPADDVLVGFQCDIATDTQYKKDMFVSMDTFNSRSTLDKWMSNHSASYTGSDVHATLVRQALTDQSMNAEKTIYLVSREGLDTVSFKDKNSPGGKRTVRVWVTPYGCQSADVAEEEKNISFQFKPQLASKASFNSDILDAPAMTGTEEEKQWIHHMLHMNEDKVIGPMLGWFVACYHRQMFHDLQNQFPLLHPVGQAGSGKSQTTLFLSRLFYFANRPPFLACGPTTTNFSLKSASVASTSVPLLLEEYKPKDIGPTRHNYLLQMFRLAYNQADANAGGVSDGSNSSDYRAVAHMPISSPIVYVGDAQETQTAVKERTVPVFFTKVGTFACERHWMHVSMNPDPLPRLGKVLVSKAMTEPLQALRERLQANMEIARDIVFERDNAYDPRLTFNAATLLSGLDFLALTLRDIFHSDCFDERIQELRKAVLEACIRNATKVVPEYALTLAGMAVNTRHADAASEYALRLGTEYTYSERNGEEVLEIAMHESFMRYRFWCYRTEEELFYPTLESFISAFKHLPHLVVDTECSQSKLKKDHASIVFALSVQQMRTEKIPLLKTPFE